MVHTSSTVLLVCVCTGVSCHRYYDTTCHSWHGNVSASDGQPFVNYQQPQCLGLGAPRVDFEAPWCMPHGGFECGRPPKRSSKPLKGCGMNFVREHCFGDGQALDNPVLQLPVYSSRTGHTFWNAFTWNEDSVSAVFPWTVKLTSAFETGLCPHYDEALVPCTGRRGASVPLAAEPSGEEVNRRSADNWINTIITTSVAMVTTVPPKLYRNRGVVTRAGTEVLPLFVGLFSMEDKVHKCPMGMMWDAFSNKCRKVRCGRGRKMIRGRCRRVQGLS